MRFTLLSLIVALGAALAVPTSVASQQKGQMVEVKMTGGLTEAAFEPATLTITGGTVVEFINVSVVPHNVAFYPDSIPKGAAEVLKKAMPNAIGELVGPFTPPNEKYDVSFAGAPPGIYRGYCPVHFVLGQRIVITVK